MSSNSAIYLKSLCLKNFATFENQEISFHHGLNAIIGETGSGKSLIIDALGLILGQRADKKLIRKDAEHATVEAVFQISNPSICAFFKSIDYPIDGNEVVVRRIIYNAEGGKSYLNFQQCPLNILNAFSRRFIDLVGQFENQKLLSEEYQLELLDLFSGMGDLKKNYAVLFSELAEKKKELNSLLTDKASHEQREDFIRFQINEIQALNPSLEDESMMISLKEKITAEQKAKGGILALLQKLSEHEPTNILSEIKSSIQIIERNVLPLDWKQKLSEANLLVEDVAFSLSKMASRAESENQLSEIVDRLDGYQRLKRKFGGTTETLLEHFAGLKKELDSFANIDDRIDEITKSVALLEPQVLLVAEQMHTKRSQAAEKLSGLLTNAIRTLKMDGATLNVSVERGSDLGIHGLDQITLLAETNRGEGWHKVKDIASGGELSRILLALRQILASAESVSVFLFDEIDAGIGGTTAIAVGKALKEVAGRSQVIAITHLPHIAQYADKLISVSKTEMAKSKDGTLRTISTIKEVGGNDKDRYIKSMSALKSKG